MPPYKRTGHQFWSRTGRATFFRTGDNFLRTFDKNVRILEKNWAGDKFLPEKLGQKFTELSHVLLYGGGAI